MTPKPVDGQLWRSAYATALEERVTAIQIWIVHTENLLEMFEGQDDVCKELRGAAGIVRMRSNDLRQEAEKIRAELADHE